MDLQQYFYDFCDAFGRNPQCAQDYGNDPEVLAQRVRYDARNFGAGLAGYSDSEVESLLYLTWDAYIKAFVGYRTASNHMGNFSNKKLFSWIMEAKHDAEARGWNCKRANEKAGQS